MSGYGSGKWYYDLPILCLIGIYFVWWWIVKCVKRLMFWRR